jgi:hypothetical protein
MTLEQPWESHLPGDQNMHQTKSGSEIALEKAGKSALHRDLAA